MSEEFLGVFHNLKDYIKRNKFVLFLILGVYLLVNINISLAEYPYIDDIGRQILGYTGFSEHYSRYVSEFSARLIQGGAHLTDPGLTTNIISAFILTFASTILLFVLFPSKKVTPVLALASTVIGINPWFLEPLSFRFDNPFMSLSILVSILPFIFWESRKLFSVCSVVCIYLMCNSYQASSGIYILMTLTLLFLEVVYSGKMNIKSLICSVLSYVGGMALYKIQITIKPPIFADQGKIPSLLHLPSIMLANAKGYLKNIYLQSSKVWILLFLVILILLVFNIVSSSKQKKIVALAFTFAWLGLGSILSYGSYLILSEQFYLLRPRYEYGLGIFASIVLVISLGITNRNQIINILKSVFSSLLIFYFLAFSFIYVSNLKQQNNTLEVQSAMLGNSLNKYLNDNNNVVNINRFVANSPIYENTTSVYPMISSLIMPNTNVSWDMTMRFNAVTKLNVDFRPFDATTVNSEYKQLETTKMYNVYTKDNELFVVMK